MRISTMALAAALAALVALPLAGCGGGDAGDDGASGTRTTRTTAVDPKLIATGKRLFAKNCHSCHELAGKPPGKPPVERLAPNLDEVKLPASHVRERITSGGYEMGAFGFPEPKLRALVTYVATTAGRNVESEEASEVSAGEQIFREQCERCHSIAGRPVQGKPIYTGTNFNIVKPSERFVVKVLHDELAGSMPLFSERLSNAQMRDVAAYVHAVAGEGSEEPN